MVKKSICLIILIFLTHSCLFADEDKPVVIALAPFCDFSGCEPDTILSLRDKVISNLLENYNCVILSRSNGFSISMENQLSIFNNLERDKSLPVLPAADYGLIGYFKIFRRTPGQSWSVDLGCTMLTINLKEKGKNEIKKFEFIPDEMSLYDGDITKEIVKALNLKAKKKARVKRDDKEKINETWAVLPIKRFESKKAIGHPPDKELAMVLEFSLQQSQKLKNIVDHNEIDKVLKELKIESFNSSTENSARPIAKILGADKLVMGSVSKLNKKKTDLRIDLFLVDGRKALILDAVTSTIPPENLHEKASELVLDFIKYQSRDMELRAADPELLNKEASIYQEVLNSLANQWMKQKAEHAVQLTDAIFLLKEKSDESIYMLGKTLLRRILNSDIKVTSGGLILDIKERKKLVDVIDKLLSRVQYSKTTPLSLLFRAEAFLQIDDVTKSTDLINQHLQQHPEENPEYANALLAYVAYKEKDCPKTLELLKKAGKNNLGKSVRAWTYVQMNDSQNEYEELQNLKALDIGKRNNCSLFVARRIRLQHKLESYESAFYFVRHYMQGYLKPNPEIQFEIARIYLSKGDKQLAASILKEINDPKVLEKSQLIWLEDKRWFKKLKKEVSDFVREMGTVNNQWWKLKDIRNFSKYKVYIQPVGNLDVKILDMAAVKVEDFLGCKVEILPRLPFPEDDYCFFKGRGQYESTHVWERCKVARKLPEDAIMLVNISEKDMFRGNYNFIYVWWKYITGEKSITYHKWWGNRDCLIADLIAKTILGCLNIQIQRSVCELRSCLFSLYSNADDVKNKNFAICDTCKAKYEEADLAFALKDFHLKYNQKVLYEKGNRIRDQESYNKIVRQTLEEARKKAEEEAKKPVDYQPAADLAKEPVPGLKYQYFEFDQDVVKTSGELAKLSTKETGVTDAFNVDKAKLELNYGLVFDGYIKIPEDGKYQFYLTSDDASRLWIDDKEVIENDKMQAPTTKMAEVALKAGYHKIKVAYLQAGGGAFLTLYWRGPKTLGQQILAEVLFHLE